MARDLGLGRTAATALGLTLASLAVLAPAASADTVGVPIAVPGIVVFYGVACPTATRCEAVGDDGRTVVVPIIDGIPGAPIPVPGTYELKGIACESATTCIAVGDNAENSGVVVPMTGGTPGVPIAVPGTISIDGIACQSATSCMAVGAANAVDSVVLPITGSTPGAPVSVPGIGLDAVACQTATSCTAVGSNSTSFAALVLPITNGTPGAAVTVPGGAWRPGTAAIACQTAIDCTAVGINEGNFGIVVPIRNGTPGTPIGPPSYAAFFGVACESATTCEGVGQTGIGSQKGAVVPILNGAPGYPIPAPNSFTRPSLNAVACPSATSCEVVGTSGYNGLVVGSCTPAAGQGCAELSGHANSRHAVIADKVKCVGSSGQTCVITERLTTTSKRVVATKRITIKAGHTAGVRLELNRTGKRLLGKLRKLPVTLTISRAQGASPFVILDRALTLSG